MIGQQFLVVVETEEGDNFQDILFGHQGSLPAVKEDM
jgi:hypothetical protein